MLKTEELSALIVGVGGIITAVGIQIRGVYGERFSRKVDAAAALLSGYTDMVEQLRQELRECNEAGSKAVEIARDHARRNAEMSRVFYESERDNWRIDKADLKSEIAAQNEEIDTLKAQVYALMARVERGGGPH